MKSVDRVGAQLVFSIEVFNSRTRQLLVDLYADRAALLINRITRRFQKL